MRYFDERHHLRVEIDTKGCDVPPDQRARMQTMLAALGQAVSDFPMSDLSIKVVYHPRSSVYHVKLALKLPGQTLFTGEENPYLDTAFQRCLTKMTLRVEDHKARPDGQRTAEAVGRRIAFDRDLVAPEAPEAGPLAEAARAGDYRTFRNSLAGYEEWLRKRIGRWIQRYPEADSQVGNGLSLGDVVEEVYLNAFEHFTRRPTTTRLSDWLDSLIDPSVKALLLHPDEVRENASLARRSANRP